MSKPTRRSVRFLKRLRREQLYPKSAKPWSCYWAWPWGHVWLRPESNTTLHVGCAVCPAGRRKIVGY